MSQHINGITAVATPRPFPSDPYPRLMETNANWICLVPYGFSRVGQTKIWYNSDRQWWGEKPEGVIENVKLAKKNGLKVFLKPQIYVPAHGQVIWITKQRLNGKSGKALIGNLL